MGANMEISDPAIRRSTDWATRRLHKALARRCRGETRVESGDSDALRAALGELGVPLAGKDGPARTVLLAGIIEFLPPDEAAALLARHWDTLSPGGRLIVTVPNRDAGIKPGFDRKRLRRLLKPLGSPKLAADQPFRWLTMIVSKPRRAEAPLKPVRRDRYQATARICRGKVIELGCGEGYLTRMLREGGHEVMGVDMNAKKIAAARSLHPDIRFVCSDIRDFDSGGELFDTAVLAEVIEHVPEAVADEILDCAWRLLGPGGRLIVSVPNQDLVPHPNHLREFDRKSLKEILSRYGRPRIRDDQPLKWLMMVVDKP